MVYGDIQFFDIIVFAVIAAFIIYRLRSVLGKRTGFQKNITTNSENNSAPKQQKTNNVSAAAEPQEGPISSM